MTQENRLTQQRKHWTRKRWRAEEQAPITHKEVGVELTNFADLTLSGYIYKYPWKSKVGTYSQNHQIQGQTLNVKRVIILQNDSNLEKEKFFFFLCITHLFLDLYFQGKIDIN